jgi:hypothetical protein
MNKVHALTLLTCLAMFAGCSRNEPPAAQPPTDNKSAHSMFGRIASNATEQVREQMENHNITLKGIGSQAKAEITPQGDLLLEGKKVAITDAQRALLMKYRTGIIAVATTGVDIGMQGADFGVHAASKALHGVFSGNTDRVNAEIDAEASQFEAKARRICDHLAPLLDTQQKLVAQLPEFKPYAKMEQSDIDDCGKDAGEAVASSTP